MPDRRTGELTGPEAKACVYRAQGLSQSEAVRQAFKRVPTSTKLVNEKASRLFARPAVQARIRELLLAAKVTDIISIGRWGQMVLDGAEEARVAGNMAAFANLTRQLGQAVGALKDTVSMTVEQRTSDKELIEQLSNDEPATLAALQRVLGGKDSFDA